jgi:hypothetical protein
LEAEPLAFDTLAALVLLLEPVVDDRALASRNILRRIKGVEEPSAPERPFIFIKGVLGRCVDQSVGGEGLVIEMASDGLSDLGCSMSIRTSHCIRSMDNRTSTGSISKAGDEFGITFCISIRPCGRGRRLGGDIVNSMVR